MPLATGTRSVARIAQNLYGYIGTQGTRYSLLMFDFNIVLGDHGSWAPGTQLFTVNGQDPNMARIYNEPVFRRMYWRALQELVNGPLDTSNSGAAAGCQVQCVPRQRSQRRRSSSIKTWLRRPMIASLRNRRGERTIIHCEPRCAPEQRRGAT